MLKLMLQNAFSTSFPNIYILFCHYLPLLVTNCTGKRSFSHPKRIKSALKSAQTQNRLNNLSLLNIEGDLLQKLDFSTVIEAFSSAKCKKKILLTFWSVFLTNTKSHHNPNFKYVKRWQFCVRSSCNLQLAVCTYGHGNAHCSLFIINSEPVFVIIVVKF